MTNQEIICAFMEPKPADGTGPQSVSECGWWKVVYTHPANQWKWFPNDEKVDSLDALREVQERLTDAQSHKYDHLLYVSLVEERSRFLYTWHATAEQKIAALGPILLPLIKQKEQSC